MRGSRWLWLCLGLLALASLVMGGVKAAQAPPPPITRVQTEEKAMALSINVVWGTDYVPSLLNILQNHHATATFMLGGAWAEAHPDLVRALAAAHMELGNHGYGHRHSSLLDLRQNLSEIERTNQVVAAISGQTPRLFAPPYGEYNATVLQAAHQLGMPVILWTLDTIDWRPSSSPERIIARVVPRARPGAIVLLHPTDRTVEALPRLIAELQRQGYRLVTVSDLLRLGPPRHD